MVKKIRRRRPIDSRDREILRFLHNANRPISGTAIATKINLSPPAIKPRLINLKNKGIVKPIKIGGMRTFRRVFPKRAINIQSPSKILWGLDLRKKKKRR